VIAKIIYCGFAEKAGNGTKESRKAVFLKLKSGKSLKKNRKCRVLHIGSKKVKNV
jgi:hypothetical protein